MKKTILITLALFITTGCGDSNNREDSPKAKAIYNQAYQENYEADSIEDIVKNVKDAYVLVDPFQDDVALSVTDIQKNSNEVGGYISVGTGENYRDDFDELEPYLSTKAWEDWSDEFFVSETTTGILPIMKKRIDKMARWGLDWVEFDNMDWVEDEENRQKYELKVTLKEGQEYINALCDYTHSKGMKCMAKNSVIAYNSFDGVLYESFSNKKNWWDRDGTKSFLEAGKLVIINHYNEKDCDAVYEEYKAYYKSDAISFICEDVVLGGYRHYNLHLDYTSEEKITLTKQ